MAEKCPANLSECPHAQASADLAVKKVFAILGVNIDVPKDVEAFREDLRFGGTMRRTADRGMLAVVIAIIGVLVAALMAALWAGIVSKIGGH